FEAIFKEAEDKCDNLSLGPIVLPIFSGQGPAYTPGSMELDLFHNSQTNETRFKQTKRESQTNETRFKRTKRDSQTNETRFTNVFHDSQINDPMSKLIQQG